MIRKAIQLAGKTLVVSLPSKWAKKNNIVKGDELIVDEEEKSLVISTEKLKEREKIVLNTAELGKYDPLYIAYLYQAGIDEIRINYDDQSVFTAIQEKLPDLMGYEIIDQGQNYVEIKNISIELEEEFENILRRTFHIIEEMGRSSLEAIKENNKGKLKVVLPLENSVDKFTDFCKRVLNKRGYKDSKKTQFYYVIIRDLEKIADYYEKISSYVIENGFNLSKELIELYNEANEFFSLFHKLFYKFDKDKASEFQKKKKELSKKANELMKTSKREELYIVYNLMSFVKMTGNLYGPYYATRI
ncbi:MAG: phosphate uptake regulator PhoU [archaeon]